MIVDEEKLIFEIEEYFVKLFSIFLVKLFVLFTARVLTSQGLICQEHKSILMGQS